MRHTIRTTHSILTRAWLPGLMSIALFATGCATTDAASNRSRFDDRIASTDGQEKPSARTLYAMARILESQEKYPQAELVLHNLTNQYPMFIPAYSDLADLMNRQGRTDAAIQELNKALEFAPNDPVVHNNLGICLLMKTEYADALHHFESAVNAAPHEARFHANKALALGLLGRNEEADALYRRVLAEEDAAHNVQLIQELRAKHTD